MSAIADNVRAFYASHGDVTPQLAEACLREEIIELDEALDEANPRMTVVTRSPRENQEHLARELADVVWTAYGFAAAKGIDLDIALAAIGAANMAKLPDCERCKGRHIVFDDGLDRPKPCPNCNGTGKGKPYRREDGKILRPESWTPPDMSAAIK